ncbi:hypothetical protein SLG_22310 [Sphingobium sp. SYK-6]|nr:hypothetical protein SLG_22310 [Sphingobium sp. SYK-6]
MVALAISLAWGFRVDGLRAARTAERDQFARENRTWADKHAMQERSIVDLTRALDAKSAESDRRAEAYRQQAEDDARRLAAMDKAATTTDQRIARLREIAKQGPSMCGVDDELREALSGI